MSGIRRDKYFTYNTLVCLAMGIQGKVTTVDLRNESCVYGKIVQVDGCMNLVMNNVIYVDSRGGESAFDSFFVHTRNIRYIHIPNELSIKQIIITQLEEMKKGSRSFTQKVSSRAMKRHIETLKNVYGEK